MCYHQDYFVWHILELRLLSHEEELMELEQDSQFELDKPAEMLLPLRSLLDFASHKND
jgi:hypothetical protein